MDAFPPIFLVYRQHCSKRRNTIMARSCTVLVCKILCFFSKPNQSRSETSLNCFDHTPKLGFRAREKQPVSILNMSNHLQIILHLCRMDPGQRYAWERGELNTTRFKKRKSNFAVAKIGQRKWHSTFIAQDEKKLDLSTS